MITNPNAKRVLVFGDSLSWGYIPGSHHERWPVNVRWPGKLQDLLGDGYEVIEENLNSRAIDNVDSRPGKEGRRALDFIEACLDTHDPLDYVLVLLGTNELKHEYANTAEMIGEQMKGLLQTIMKRPSQFRQEKSELILISPPFVDETREYCKAGDKYLGATAKSEALGAIYARLADELGIRSINLTKLVLPGEDGIHLDAMAHARVAEEVATLFQPGINGLKP